MRKIKRPKIGELVLATRWGDKDPKDPWFIGHVEYVGKRYKLKESPRFWKHVFRISEKEASDWLEKYSNNT